MTPQDVKRKAAHAARTLAQLPLNANERPVGLKSSWPVLMQSASELKETSRPVNYRPHPTEIDEMNHMFDALMTLRPSDRILIWSRACRIPWRQVQIRFGWSRTHANRRHHIALMRLAKIMER